jgi:lactate racemase
MDLPSAPFRLEAVSAPRPPVSPIGDDGIHEALSRPIASPSLVEIFHGARRVLVVVSDATRATGSDRYLPPLVERIEAASKAEIRFAVASGIHRRPTPEDVEAILGTRLAGRHEVLLHDPDDRSRLLDLGRTRAGTPVAIHAAVREHDRVVLTGAVGFHYYAGFSGGRKAVVPGLAARATVTANHLRALRADGTRHPSARAGRLRGNPVHLDMADGAALVGPHLLVNSVLADDGAIERLWVGHWRRAHEAACRHVRATRSVKVRPRDLVVAAAGGEPTDINLIQAHKAFEAAVAAVRPQGVFVLVARCREGAGHADFLPFFRHGSEAEMVGALRDEFRVYRQTALAWHRKAKSCRLILVSGLPASTARLVGAEPARDLEEAFRMARATLPAGARGWVLDHGSRWLLEKDAAGASPRA